MASRVLYVLLALITVLLLAIAPIHLQETLDWRLSSEINVKNPQRLVRRIVEDKDSQKPIARIWDMLPKSTRSEMTKIVERKDNQGEPVPGSPPPESFGDIITNEQLIEDLNKIIEDPKFYRPEDWENRILPAEAEEFIESGVESLTEIRSKRFNRLLISTAVAPTIDTGEASALALRYAIWEFPIPITMTSQQFGQLLTTQVPWFFEKFVLSIGLLIAIIVTANMIPDMFEPGSLNLLLSKPISRWGLFVSKFFGGCVFIGLCACYLFIGLWLWMGIGMGIWDRAMLLSIPLYIIVFAIYFSVSAVVGLLWRSPIVSVILTLLFWAFCFAIGSSHGFFNVKMKNNELIALVPVEDQVYSVDRIHRLKGWNETEGAWENGFDSKLPQELEMTFEINGYIVDLENFPGMPGLDNVIAPVYDSKNSQLFSSSYDMSAMTSGKKRLFVGKFSEGEAEFSEAGKFPLDAARMFETKNGMVVASSDGSFYRLDQTKLEEAIVAVKELAENKPKKPARNATKVKDGASEAETKAEPENVEAEASQESAPRRGRRRFGQMANNSQENEISIETFDRIGPDSPLSVRTANHVDYCVKRDEFVIYRRGKIRVYRPNNDPAPDTQKDGEKFVKGKIEQYAELELELGFDKSMTARVAYQGDLIVIAFGNGKVITVDAETLKEKNDYQPENRTGIDSLLGSRSGRFFGVHYRNGNLWLLDTESESELKKAEVVGQGTVSSFRFDRDDHLWVCDNTDRASEYDLVANKMNVRHSPSGGLVEKIYRIGLKPFYTICPKPGEFYKVVSHLSSSGDSEENADVDMNKTQEANDPWGPLWSGLLFMFVMLFFGCLVFRSKDY